MSDQRGTLWREKWFWRTVVVAVVVVVGAFVAGIWFAGRKARSVERTLDSYAAVYEGSDSTKDVPDLLPLYAEDAVLRDVARDRTYEGADAIRSALESLFGVARFDLTIEQVSVAADWALVSWTADGQIPGTGRPTQVSGVTRLDLSKGRITRETWYYDPAKSPF